MAFTKITAAIKAEFGNGLGPRANAYFHPEDIDIVLDQPGANAIHHINVRVNGQDCAVIIGVNEFTPAGVTTLLDEVDDLIALPCPPFNQAGGIRI
jgi:hypothetical protein